MSKVRIPINPMQVGRVGAYSMYVRSGEQIVRQRKNSSNYGPEASRTESQMTRRVKWSSLVNFYKVCSAWMPKAYETLKQGQTVYNKFMQLNINKAHCALTKDMAQNGCCCIENWTVSQGSLSPIELDPPIGDYGVRTNIVLASAINATTTVKSLSEDIIANNSMFQNGDNIAMVWFKNYFDSRTYPFAVCEYFEFTLDTENTALLNTTEAGAVIASGNLTDRTVLTTKSSAVEENGANAFVFIHTRKVGGQLKVSTQDIYVSVDDYTDPFTGSQAIQAAIDSYGVTEEVPLDPSFNSGSIDSILVNGTPIVRDLIFNQAVTLDIVGSNMTGHVYVKKGNTLYMPLTTNSGGMDWTYILDTNGTYKIYLNDELVRTVILQDVQHADGFPNRLEMWLRASANQLTDRMLIESGYNINYPHVVDSVYTGFKLSIGSSTNPFNDATQENYSTVNCTVSITVNQDQTITSLVITPTDADALCYVKYKGYILAVFNYTS